MRKRLLCSLFVAWCAVGCTSEDPSATDPALQASGEVDPDAPPGPGCEILCASYDSSDCREICPPDPVDASAPEDPYAGDPPVPGDAGVQPPSPQNPPSDPHAATDRRSRDHQAC